MPVWSWVVVAGIVVVLGAVSTVFAPRAVERFDITLFAKTRRGNVYIVQNLLLGLSLVVGVGVAVLIKSFL